MKTTILSILLTVVAVLAGIAIGRWWPSEQAATMTMPAEQERKVLYWKAPMDPNYRRDEPGKSPMGMDLVPVYADEAQGATPGVVKIDATVINNLGVRTDKVAYGSLARRIETVGYVAYDENSQHQINTRVEGWVEKLAIKASGDPVSRGQMLFELYSPTLVNAQQEYLAAIKSSSAGLRNASRDRLQALGMTAAQIKRLDTEQKVRQRIQVYAPNDGIVAHLGVREGQFVTPMTAVMAIVSLDQVWVQAEVFERQSAWVQPGQRALIELDYQPGKQWHGTVDYLYPELDPRTRTLKVRLQLENKGQALRPNMYARVTLYGDATAPVVHIPREALIRGGKVDRVVLALGDGRFRSQPVTAGIESGTRIEIRNGLSAGDTLVTSGQFLIDSESNIDSAFQRMDDSSAGVDMIEHNVEGPASHDTMHSHPEPAP